MSDIERELAETKAALTRAEWLLRDAEREIQSLREVAVETPRHPLTGVVKRVREERLTYLQKESLDDLATEVHEIEKENLPGILIETGTALGGSAIVIAAAKSVARVLRVYDVFGMIPAPSERDGEEVRKRYEDIAAGRSRGLGGDRYYGYRDDLLAEVTASFERFALPLERNNIELVKGLFQDTLTVDEPVALAHLDGDWYESTKACLERIAPHVVTGGRLILDDYFHWQGCRLAVDEYFAGRPGWRYERRDRLHVVRDADR